jgi:hypothetical protein
VRVGSLTSAGAARMLADMERPDRGITVGIAADKHDDWNSRPAHGTGRRIASVVWDALQAMEPGCAVNANSPDPGTVVVTVKLNALRWWHRRRRRLVTTIAEAAARGAVAAGFTPRVRIVAAWAA